MFTGDSKLVGHGLPFGSVGHFAQEVEKSEGSIKPTTFINRYGVKDYPVLLQGIFLYTIITI